MVRGAAYWRRLRRKQPVVLFFHAWHGTCLMFSVLLLFFAMMIQYYYSSSACLWFFFFLFARECLFVVGFLRVLFLEAT